VAADGEKISKISLVVLTQLTNVTDTQTPHDGIGRAYASHCAAKTGRVTEREKTEKKVYEIREDSAICIRNFVGGEIKKTSGTSL